jgi:hypothetical protein
MSEGHLTLRLTSADVVVETALAHHCRMLDGRPFPIAPFSPAALRRRCGGSPGHSLCRAMASGWVVEQRLFTRGVPASGREYLRVNFWLFNCTPPSDGKPMEVVVERFTFLAHCERRIVCFPSVCVGCP